MNAKQRRRMYEREAKQRADTLDDLIHWASKTVEAGMLMWLRASRVGDRDPRFATAAKRLSRDNDYALTVMAFARVERDKEVEQVTYCVCGFPSPHPDEDRFHHDDACIRTRRLRVVSGGAHGEEGK